VDSSGKRQPLIDEPGSYNNLQLSPDGRRLIAIGGAFDNVWVYDLERGNIPTQLTSDRGHGSAIWGPNGRYVIFDSAKGLSWVRADGSSSAPQLLIPSENRPVPTSYTQIGKRLAYYTSPFSPRPEIWTVSLEEQDGQLKAGQPERFLDDRLAGFMPVFSPDGRWLAYESLGQQAAFSELARGQGRGGRSFRRGGEGAPDRELIVRPFPPPAAGQEQQVQISNKGSLPHWSQNGQDLVYQSGDQIMAVSYTVKANEFVPGKARVAWTNLSFGTGNSINSPWDLKPDGKGLVVSTRMDVPEPAKAEPVHTVVILQNFFDELKRRAPVGK
jgi:Tol biopolymer transport system component